MIEIVLIASLFIVVLLLFVVLLAVHIKSWSSERDRYYIKKHQELQGEINDLKRLFVKEIKDAINSVKDVLNINI